MKLNERSKFILIFLLGAISFWAYNKYAFPNVDTKLRPNKEHRIAIIGAMDEEVEAFKSIMILDTVITKAGIDFYRGKIGTRKIVVLKSGIAKVNAALATQICIDDFSASQIINSGVAGSLNPKLEIGDIIIARSLQHHDIDITAFGYKPGVISRMDTSIFYPNRSIMGNMLKIGKDQDLEISYGIIVSGDQFINSENKKDSLVKLFDADAVDMESAAIAHVCYLNNIPFVVLRSMSDKADGSSPADYNKFKKKAAKNSAALIIEYLKSLD